MARAQYPWGVSWDTDGVIRYGAGSDGIWQLSAERWRAQAS